MISLARASIWIDWRRYVTIVSVLSFTGLMLITEASIFTGIMARSNHTLLDSNADLFVVSKSNQFGYKSSLYEDQSNQLWLHPNVLDVQSHGDGNYMQWQASNGEIKNLKLIPINVADGSLSVPSSFSHHQHQALLMPGAVLIPENYVKALGVNVSDSMMLLNFGERKGELVSIAGATLPILNGRTPLIYTSGKTYRILTGGKNARTTSFLIRLRQPELARETAIELQHLLDTKQKNVRVWIKSDYRKYLEAESLNNDYLTNIIFYSVGFIALFSLAITGQIMRANMYTQLKEFGTLHALGLSRFTLALIALRQGFWIGLLSIAVCTLLFLCVQTIAAWFNYALILTWLSMLLSAVLMISVAMIAGFYSASILRKIELTRLLR